MFMVPLGRSGARPMAQALRLPFEYYLFIKNKDFPLHSFMYDTITTCVCVLIAHICKRGSIIPNTILTKLKS